MAKGRRPARYKEPAVWVVHAPVPVPEEIVFARDAELECLTEQGSPAIVLAALNAGLRW